MIITLVSLFVGVRIAWAVPGRALTLATSILHLTLSRLIPAIVGRSQVSVTLATEE